MVKLRKLAYRIGEWLLKWADLHPDKDTQVLIKVNRKLRAKIFGMELRIKKFEKKVWGKEEIYTEYVKMLAKKADYRCNSHDKAEMLSYIRKIGMANAIAAPIFVAKGTQTKYHNGLRTLALDRISKGESLPTELSSEAVMEGKNILL